MKQTPQEHRERQARAMHAATSAARWVVYQMWHPDFETVNYSLAYQDFKAGISLADVYFARGLPIPKAKHGIPAPEWLFR